MYLVFHLFTQIILISNSYVVLGSYPAVAAVVVTAAQVVHPQLLLRASLVYFLTPVSYNSYLDVIIFNSSIFKY